MVVASPLFVSIWGLILLQRKNIKTKLDVIIDFIGIIDNEQNKCYIASNYNYSKPNIIENSDKSFVNFKKMRHPLIEHLNTKELYVTNDLGIGLKDDYMQSRYVYGKNDIDCEI